MFPIKQTLSLFLLVSFLFACGGEEETASKAEKQMEKAAAPAVETEPVTTSDIVVEAPPLEESKLVPEAAPELKHDVVYEEEIYDKWPDQSTVQASMSSPSTTSELVPEPRPELKHDVVNQEEIYKNWLYQKEAREAETSMKEQAMGKAKEAMDSISSEMEEKAVNKMAEVTGQSTESVAKVVAVAKEAAGATPATTGGTEHTVNAKGLTAFDRPIIYIAPGDTVHFKKMAGGHNSESVFVPEGGESWKGAMNKNISVTLTVPGIYGYLCLPHAGLGMNGVIVVGDAGDKEKVMEYLRGLPQTDFARKLLGKVNKVKPENYIK